MKKLITCSAISIAFLFSGCSDNSGVIGKDGAGAQGGIYTGGVLRVNEVNNVKSLMPISINEVTSFHIASQVYEGLVKYNHADLTIIPALARSWDISPDHKEF